MQAVSYNQRNGGAGGTSLVVQWIAIHQPMQRTWFRSLVWEDPTCRGSTKPWHRRH